MANHVNWRDASGLDYRRFLEERNAATGAFLSLDPDLESTPSKEGSADIKATKAQGAPGTATAQNTRRTPGSPAPGGSEGLARLPFAVKDNIAVADRPLTCGSKLLADFVSPYTATAVQRLLDVGARPVGKTNLDEFGMGSSTENSALGATNNPWNIDHVPGGSSGGSAAAVAAGMVPFALGSDTGGSVRQPAAFCGVYGLKPTYGSVSRHGLVAYASSLDVIGVLATRTDLTRSVFQAIRGVDPFDQSSVHLEADLPESGTGTIAIVEPSSDLSPAVADSYRATVAGLEKAGRKTVTVEPAGLDYAVAAYYTIATAEAAANLARFTGIRYGARPAFAENPEELVRSARTEGFGSEVKLRILLGTYVLRSGFQDQYYVRALKVRSLLREELAKVFGIADALLLPTYPSQAFSRGGGLTPMQQKLGDKYTTIANLSGFPALAFPAGVVDGLPVGHQLMGPAFSELRLLSIADELASVFPLESPPDFPAAYVLREEGE